MPRSREEVGEGGEERSRDSAWWSRERASEYWAVRRRSIASLFHRRIRVFELESGLDVSI